MFTTQGGRQVEADTLAQEALAVRGIEGVSVLGGEPFEQAEGVAEFCEQVKSGGLSVMVYSGYTLAELKKKSEPAVSRLLAATDLLVDGRYQKEHPETRRRWLGSSNQVMHFFTSRYSPDDERFYKPNTVELRWLDGQLTVNGWPQAADAFRKRAK